MNLNEIINTKSTVKLLDDDIVFVLYKEGAVLEIEDLNETQRAFNEISLGRPFKVLSELGDYTTLSGPARKHAETVGVLAHAEAIVFKGLAQILLLRFLETYRTQSHPMKFFKSKESALAWLKSV
jgi:hypothetical protein